MKRKSLLLLLLLALGLPWAAKAQETLTVYENGGTNTNQYIPLYGYYCDVSGTQSQFIIPAAALENMTDGTISKLTFYCSNSSLSFGSGVYEVWLEEVEETEFTSTSYHTYGESAVLVYRGALSASNNMMEITFQTAYEYGGGNLMIGTKVATGGSCPYSYWYGENQTSYTALCRNSRYQFLPKTTFTYEPAAQGDCEKPETLVASNVTGTSATLTWSGGSGTYNVEVKGGEWADWTEILHETNLTTTSLTLQPLTSYQARVQSVCTGETPTSGWKTTSFSTPCSTYNVTTENYTYGFETSQPYDCWTVIGGTVAIVDHTSSQPTHDGTDGSKHLKFSSSTSNMVTLPTFEEATNTLRIELWTRPESNTNSSCGSFSIGYLTDLSDASTFHPIATYNYNDWTAKEYVKKTVDFNNPDDDVPADAYIALRQHDCSSSWYWFVDDVTVKPVPSCLEPVLGEPTNITATTATINWTQVGTVTSWNIRWRENGTTGDYQTATSNTTSYQIPGLTGNTTYEYGVQATCGSEWSDGTFITSCPEFAGVPFTQNFDGITGSTSNTTNNLPRCWDYFNASTYSSNQNYPIVYNGNYYNSPNSLKFYIYNYSASNDAQPQYAILPAVQNVSGLRMKLYARAYNTGSSYTNTFKVGVMEGTDVNTFETIETINLTSTSYTQYIISFDNYTGNGTRIAILMEVPTTTYAHVYIDNITVEEVVNVTAYQIVNTVSDPATQMTWDEFATHVNNGHSFTHTTITLMDDINVSTMVGTSDNPFTGTFNGDSHTITANITTTETGAAPFSHINGATIKNLTVTGTISSSANHLGGLVGFTDGGTNRIENCLVSTTLTGEAGYGLCGGIIGHGKSATNYIVGCVFDGTIDITNTDTARAIGGLLGWSDTSELHIINSVFAGTKTANGTQRFHPMGCVDSSKTTTGEITNSYYFTDGTITDNDNYAVTKSSNLVGKGKHAYTITGVDPVYVDFSGEHTLYNMSGIDAYAVGLKRGYTRIAGEGDEVTLALEGAAGYEANHGTLTANGETFTLLMEAYDTEISGIDCPVPYNVAANNVAAQSAQISWTGNSDSYTLQYREVITAPVEVNDTYDFEDGTQGWTTIDADGHGDAWSRNTSGGYGSNNCMRAKYNSTYAHQDYLVSPQITLGGSLSFYAKQESTSYSDSFRVYLSTSGNSASDFTIELTDGNVTPTTTYAPYTYDLSSYSGMGYVAIVYTAAANQYYLYIDDIKITATIAGEYGEWQTVNNAVSPQALGSLTPETTYQVQVKGTCAGVETDYSDVIEFTTPATCPAPTELAVTDGSVTAHEATITWTDNAGATSWTVEYADNAEFNDGITEQVNETPTYTFSDLDGETTYYVRVKADCDVDDQSQPSNVVNFTTLVACQAPTVLTVTEGSVTTNQVELSWTENGTATAWQICLNGDETNLIAANSNPFTLESLTAATSYTVKVRANCGGIDGESGWSNTVNFTTDCGAIALPYTYGFENAGQLACWTMTDCISSTGINTSAKHTGTYGFGFHWVANSQQCLISPEFESTTAQVAVSFYYMNSSSNWEETFHVGYSTTTNDVAAFTWGDEITADENDWALYSDVFPAGTKYVALKHTSDDAFYLYVDDFSFQPVFTKTIAAVGEENWEGGRGGYYLIASPLAENVTPNAANGFIVGDYDLYYFSQTGDGEGNEWINFKDETLGGYPIVNGKGYLYASKEGTTLTFTGAPGTISTVQLDTYETGANLKGWNLIGNPFAQDAYITKDFYTLENGDTYTPNTAGTAIHTMQGVLITAEADETSVTFTTEAPAANNSKLNMNLSRANKQLDNAILVFGGDQQLGKMTFRANSSKIFMPVEGKDYAITSVEGQVGEVPVSFKAEKNGTYSLSFTNEEVSFSYLHLIDNMTGNDVNLLQTPSYTFDARTSDYESRFRLVFATGSSANDDTFGFVNASGNLCIFGIEGEATVQVIDMLGHVISSETFSGSYEKKINGAPGVYLVRLINGENVKTQKVVVR